MNNCDNQMTSLF